MTQKSNEEHVILKNNLLYALFIALWAFKYSSMLLSKKNFPGKDMLVRLGKHMPIEDTFQSGNFGGFIA